LAKKLTYYEQLGVSRNAPEEVIRGAYKALAQKNHPDKNLGNPNATNIMQEINLAYDVLSDPSKKAAYDSKLDQEEAAAARVHQQRPSQSPRYGVPAQPFAMQPSRRRGGAAFLIVTLLAAIFIAFFVYVSGNPISVRPLLPVMRASESIPAFPVIRPKPAEAYVPRETTSQELAVCIFAAAKAYTVPPPLLLGLLSVEGGAAGESKPAPGHTYDLGLMQINSFWIPQLAKVWEVSEETALRRVRDDSCVNVGLGAWILQTSLAKSGDLHSEIAVYRASAHHSEDKAGNDEYIGKVMKLMELYKPIHGPEDLLGRTPAPVNK